MRSYDKTLHEKIWKENRKYLFILRHVLCHENRLNLIMNMAADSSVVSRLIGKII
jgi:hypothetical protein